MAFPGAETLALFIEGSPPEFNCMNEHYGLSFEKGDAGKTSAVGTLTADKVRSGGRGGRTLVCS